MNTVQLKNDLESCILSSHGNVYAADCLPTSKVTLPCSVIINLDSSKQKGSHWVCIHIDVQEKAEYFDSYGFPPTNPEFVSFMLKNSKIWTYNTCGLQDYFSSVCGNYCIVYLYFKTRHYTMRDFLGLFSNDRLNNDSLIRYLYNKLIMGKDNKRLLKQVLLKAPEILPILNGFLKHLEKSRNYRTSNLILIG